jgi:CheY-like chemotaxis protein
VRQHVTARLKWLGYDVVTAINGSKAIERLTQVNDFDLVLYGAD